jgi:hypothetical protein
MMSHEEVDSLFSYHHLDKDGIKRIEVFRDQYKALAHNILNGTNTSPEQTLCIRRLHESMMQINILISSEYPME